MSDMTTDPISASVSLRAERQEDHSEYFAKFVGVSSILMFAVACILYAWKSNETEWWFVSAIFSLPLLQVLAVIYTLRHEPRVHGSKVLLPALGVQMALWAAYTWRESISGGLQFLAWFALAGAVSLTGVALWFTWVILKKDQKSNLKPLLQTHSFMVTCFFLTVFTLVAIFLSLSLAFHDQGLRLRTENKAAGLFAENVAVSYKAQDSPPAGDSASQSFRILFEPGSARIRIDERFSTIAKEEIDLVASQDQQAAGNTVNLRESLAEIEKHSALDRVRVVLEGRSDEKPVGDGPYKSNFELSQARVNQVMAHLLAQLGNAGQKEWRRNIEWLALYCPDEPGAERLKDGDFSPDPQRLSVEISVLPSYGDKFSANNHVDQPLGRELNLLDYTYFGVYAITTTGYGDIIPVTAFAKFIPIVANFVHVFLIGIFFGVLISFLRTEKGVPETGAIS
jgi:flagellar motor protein MotB